MTPDEMAAALQKAFRQCEALSCPLTLQQQELLLQVVMTEMAAQSGVKNLSEQDQGNPLDELSGDERIALLNFIAEQESQKQPWKIQFMNDWLNNQDSGGVQFIRDRYGLSWLERVQPSHIHAYAQLEKPQLLKLKIGDRIEVSNGLWEWVQEEGPCAKEWIPCTIIGMTEVSDSVTPSTACVIRFDDGTEYEIQGLYEWNRYNWRRPEKSQT